MLLALALAWAACSLLREARIGYRSMTASPASGPVLAWRLGSRPAERLRHCLDEAHGLIPPGSIVTFASPPGAIDADFFRWRWAAYLLPDLDVVRPADGRADSLFLIAYRLQVDRPGLTLIRELPGVCRLYRISPPGTG